MDVSAQEILNRIIAHAESGEQLPFSFLRTWPEYFTLVSKHKTTKLIINTLRASQKRIYKNYCTAVVQGKADFTKLLVYITLDRVCAFYHKDLHTIEDMLDEYDCYVFSGNILNSLLLGQRPDEKLWDHRRR